MKPRVVFYPVLLAAFPVLSLYSSNMGLISPTEILVPLSCAIAASTLLWIVVAFFFKSIWRGALVSATVSASYFLFGHIWILTRRADPLVEKTTLIWMWWAAVVLLSTLVLVFTRKARDKVTPSLNVSSIILILGPLFSIATQWVSAKRDVALIDLTTNGNSPVHAATKHVPPDIYYIILDGFGRQDSLKHYIGLDDSPFLKGLADRGFYIADKAHPNYVQTEFSLSSSLNMDYLPVLLEQFRGEKLKRWMLDFLIDHNKVAADLKGHGYRYIAIGSGFPGVQPRSADLFLVGAQGASLFESALVDMSPFPDIGFVSISQYTKQYDRLKAAFDALVALGPGGVRPRFVFVHILAPHPPFVFNADGSYHPQRGPFGFWDGSDFVAAIGSKSVYREGYRGQAQAIANQVIVAVDGILKQSSQTPIILIQGDHGSKMDLEQDSLEKTDLRECMRNLSAYLVPPKIREKLYPSITPVNSFRVVLDGLFDAKMPLLPDRSFFSPWNEPFNFTDVTDQIERPFDQRYP